MKKILLFALFGIIVHLQATEVGTGNTYKPFTYVDEKGKAVGFDVELLEILQGYDEELKFNFHPVPFNALFAGLDSNKFDMLAHQIAKTKEREEKYIFSDLPYFNVMLNIITAKDTKINTFEELKNKNFGAVVGSNQALRIEEYAKKNPDLKIKITYFKNYGSQLLALANHQIDALLDNPIVALDYAKSAGVEIKITDLTLQKTSVYFVFNKQDENLKNRVSKALEKAKEDGKLKNLSLKYFGKDYTS